MAKTETPETRTGVENLNDTLTNIEQKVQNNSKPFIFGMVGVIAIVAVVLGYYYLVRVPAVNASNDAIGQADVQLALGNDSVALAMYQKVADEYGYAAGNRANLNAAILLYKDGKYEEALKYLGSYSGKDKVIAASAKSLEGDCYVNLKKYDEALKCFEEAVKISNDNPAYTPAFLMKEAVVYRELKEYGKEAAAYKQIIDEYPNFGPSANIDIQRYLDRAEASK